jgi:hypothetical protein
MTDPSVAPRDPTGPGRPRPTSLASRLLRIPPWILAGVTVGLLDGVAIANGLSQPGFGSLGGAILAMASVVVAAGVLAIAGVLALVERPRAAKGLAGFVLSVAAAAVPGTAIAGPLGLTYRAPVYLQAEGTATADLVAGPDFTPNRDGRATCGSPADSDAVGTVTGFDLGDLSGGRLRAMVSIDPATLDAGRELFIDGGTLPQGVAQPRWAPDAPISVLGDPASGSVSFSARLQPEPAPGGSPRGTAWPVTLAGTITWACNPWQDPDAPPPPDAAATVDLALAGVDWVPAAGATATCSGLGASGPAAVVVSEAGRLQGWPFGLELDFQGSTRVGGTTRIWIVAAMGPDKNPPPGTTYAPNWLGTATIVDLAAGGVSGSVRFDALPTGVDPSVGPAPTGWPVTVTGTLAWDCTP